MVVAADKKPLVTQGTLWTIPSSSSLSISLIFIESIVIEFTRRIVHCAYFIKV